VILIPYLGSRALMKPRILPLLLRLAAGMNEYREPFVGGGSVGLAMMSRRPDLTYWLNDRDYSVAGLWWSVRYHPEEIIERVRTTIPTVALFLEYKKYLDGVVRLPPMREELIEVGFRRLAIQYWSGRSWGGGMRGGLEQTSQENIDSRWNLEGIARKIHIVHQRLERQDAKITAYDFSRLIEDTERRAILFLDPPFFDYASNYTYTMTLEQHQQLADLLATTEHRWVLTVGDHPEMRRLYQWAQRDHIGFNNLLIYPHV